MTTLSVPFGEESVSVTVDDLGHAESGNADLQEQIDALLYLYTVKPIVNVEPWVARLIIKFFGGEIVSEPAFDPNAGDVVSRPHTG
jgi:hypothetical protein